MKRSRKNGFTLTEFIVCVVVFGILLAVALPNVSVRPRHGSMTQTLSNMKQLHLATQQMALDATTSGNTNLGWPGDIGGTFTNWTQLLVASNYLTTQDLAKLLSAPGRRLPPDQMPTRTTSALLVYAVREESPSDAVFLSSANFTNTPAGGLPPEAKATPYGNKGFLVFRKAGDGAILQPRQAGQTNFVGTFVPLCQ